MALSTLTKYPDSMLARMFNPSSGMRPARQLDNGAYFLDLEPQYFRIVLNFLRYGTTAVMAPEGRPVIAATCIGPFVPDDGVIRTAEYLGLQLNAQDIQQGLLLSSNLCHQLLGSDRRFIRSQLDQVVHRHQACFLGIPRNEMAD